MFFRVFLFTVSLLTIGFSFGQATLPLTRTTWSTGAPTGWTDNGTGSYTTSFACSTNNGGKLDGTGDYYEVFFMGVPNTLSYDIKISGSSTSSLLVEESANGVAYTTITNHTSIPTTCVNFSFSLLSTTRYVRWSYTKVSQNVTIDDVNITQTLSPCVAPASQPTNLILSNITASSIDGSFTGNGSDGYIVITSTSPTLSGNPVNGTTYNLGDPIGGGNVVSVGTSTTFTASGLSGSTTYYFFVFAYNDIGCSGAPAYNTINPLNNNGTTLVPPAFSASVVVSEYFNDSDPRDEWIELIVVIDNTDMRNWTLRDNNSNTDAWQTEITFNNIAFWNNMRGGTIIKIWNRSRSSSSATTRTIEVNKDDGYIELYADHATYFTGGDFGASPSYGGSSLNYANGGDLLQLRDASNNHVHALGHDGSPGADWTSCPTPKVLRNDNISGGESIRVVGSATTNYDGGSTTNNSIITFGSTGITSGLANDAGNELLWRTWREPIFSTQGVVGNVCGATCVNFTWNKMTDPVPSDDVQGYLILRKPTAGSFTDPTDGTSYIVGATLGGATVVTNLDNPTAGTTVTYTDNVATNGTAEYRIYGYRYTDDNINGNSFNLARGRAYNIADYVTVTLAIPLPIELLYFKGKSTSTGNLLEWSTSSEINNDYFTLEKSEDAVNYNEIGIIDGAGNSNSLLTYDFTDDNLNKSTNYYRLKQTDFDGKYTYSNIVVLNNYLSSNVYYNNSINQLEIGNIENSTISIYNTQGQLIKNINKHSISPTYLKNGVYLITIKNENAVFSKKIVVTN